MVVCAPSGGGKTTLLSVLAGLLTPARGTVAFSGRELALSSRPQMLQHRRDCVGLAFQSFNLIASLDAVENVMAPLLMSGVQRSVARRRATELLSGMGLAHRLHHRPGSLSGGEQQRVAIARGLVGDPPLFLADEPTAHLDQTQVGAMLTLLRSLVRPGRLVLVATHDLRVVQAADDVVDLSTPC
jgi:putative ABC transport system ATP-binding protein